MRNPPTGNLAAVWHKIISTLLWDERPPTLKGRRPPGPHVSGGVRSEVGLTALHPAHRIGLGMITDAASTERSEPGTS
eukprot:767678-Hanusia_phi.AAC.1